MNTFSDDELKRLKEKLENGAQKFTFYGYEIKDIIFRLEAAEIAYAVARKVIDGKASYQKLLNADAKYRKSRGEGS